ncbi:hypothetical protein DL766_004997 [Monosporascus sp. MC13-8B]|uniref:Wax synthase domain-containing protein n=1 Tax=Monosporascus cannonballus TaxID=155416 RepID=A0ABY0HD65_9PEZI|nr:hypothetical protein DL762_004126 [Monosporascus cannonballus]RYO94351.1 hypothetical protein DL763_004067 [Monosporascus cannonballus]RYP30169.1 hypothetical protein DL766_004997 [Monosporascus sp. MC13-8B]
MADPAPAPDGAPPEVNGPPFPPPGDEDDDDDFGFWSWRMAQAVLQYDGVLPNEPNRTLHWTSYTFHTKSPPFPLNFESHWYLAGSLAFVIAVHLELDTAWLSQLLAVRLGVEADWLYRQYGFWYIPLRILDSLMQTLFIALLSTLVYDGFGAAFDVLRRTLAGVIMDDIEDWWARFETPNEHGDLVRPWYLPRELFNLLLNAVITSSNLSYIGILSLMKRIRPVIYETLNYLPSDTFSRSWSEGIMPTPVTYGALFSKAFAWEVLPPVIFQIWSASAIFILALFWRVKAEEAFIHGPMRDPRCCVYYVLISAMAKHVMYITAYQLLQMALLIIEKTSLQRFLDGPLSQGIEVQLLGRTVFDGSTFASIIYYVVSAAIHYVATALVLRSCRMLIFLHWPLARPYFEWLTLFTDVGVDGWWRGLLKKIVTDCTPLADWHVYSRAVMTFLFGPFSAWPARTYID